MIENIVVTGATSMIGASIVESFLKTDIKNIYAVVREGCTKLDHIPSDGRVHVITCGMSDYKNLAQMIPEKCDVFYNIAWDGTGQTRNNSIQGQANNIVYSLDALHAAHELGCTKFVGAGSQAEYGLCDVDKIGPDTPVNPVQSYGVTKYATGKLLKMEADKLEMKLIWVRIFSVFGKYERDNTMISGAIDKLLRRERPSFTEGIQLWDFLYSEDAGDAFRAMGEKTTESRVYCLGNGEARQLREYILALRDAIDPALEVGFGDIPYKTNSIMNLCADISLLTEDTGWKPAYSFEDAIRLTVEHYRLTHGL